MLAYITATTLVKGVQNKNVYYIGDVQDDGYIYFNDDVSYRIPKPSNMLEHSSVSASDVQIWYTLRNCWIRANRFTNLQVYGVEPKNIYSRIDSLETRMSNLEERVGNLEQRMTAVENRVTVVEGNLETLNNHLGTFYRDIVLANGFNTLSEYLIDWRSKYDVVEGYLGQFWNYLNLLSYDDAGNRIDYSNMAEWMNAVKTMLRLSYTREKTNADNISSLTNTVNGHTTRLNGIDTRLNIVTVNGATRSMEGWIDNLGDSITSITNLLGDINTYVFNVPTYNPSGATNVAYWMRKIRGDVNALLNRMDSFDPSAVQPVNSLEYNLSELIQNFNNLYADLFGNTGRFVDIANELSAIEHQALGISQDGHYGNGYVLLELLKAWNQFVLQGGSYTVSDGAWVQLNDHRV